MTIAATLVSVGNHEGDDADRLRRACVATLCELGKFPITRHLSFCFSVFVWCVIRNLLCLFLLHYIMAGLHYRTRHTTLTECSFAIMISRVTSLDFCWGAWSENLFFVFISHKEYNNCIVLWWNKHNYKKCTGFTGIYATLPFCALRFRAIVLPIGRMLDY